MDPRSRTHRTAIASPALCCLEKRALGTGIDGSKFALVACIGAKLEDVSAVERGPRGAVIGSGEEGGVPRATILPAASLASRATFQSGSLPKADHEADDRNVGRGRAGPRASGRRGVVLSPGGSEDLRHGKAAVRQRADAARSLALGARSLNGRQKEPGLNGAKVGTSYFNARDGEMIVCPFTPIAMPPWD